MRTWLGRYKATTLVELPEECDVDLNGLRAYEGYLRRLHKSGSGSWAMVSKLRSAHNVKCSHRTMRSWIDVEESAPGEALCAAVVVIVVLLLLLLWMLLLVLFLWLLLLLLLV